MNFRFCLLKYTGNLQIALCNITAFILSFAVPHFASATTHPATTDSGWILDSDKEYEINNNVKITSQDVAASALIILDAPANNAGGQHIIYGGPISTVYNNGEIIGREDNIKSSGIEFRTSGVLQNGWQALISGGDDAVKLVQGDHDVYNDGMIISSSANGISVLAGTAYIRNYADIWGQERAIDGLDSAGVTLFNMEAGVIGSVTLEALALDTDSEVYNAGTILSVNNTAILLAGSDNHLTLDTGSAITGKAGVALLSKGTGNTLTLTGHGSENDSFMADNAAHGLAKLTSVSESDWTLSGTTQAYGTAADVLDVAGQLAIAGNMVIEGGGGATVQHSGVLKLVTGGALSGNLLNNGTLILDDQAQPGLFTTTGNVINAGAIQLSPAGRVAGNTLRIDGNYVGRANSTLHLNGLLSDDASPVDRLDISGNASGVTEVVVTNVGGTGAKTLEGIPLIGVGGKSEKGAFVQKGRIVAGNYDYFLRRGSASQPQGNSWYLSSTARNTSVNETGKGVYAVNVDSQVAATAKTPVAPISPVPAQNQQSANTQHVLRPEAGAYAMNSAISNTLFVTRLAERLTAANGSSSLWLRQSGTHQRSQAGDQLDNSGNQYVVQAGSDIAQFQANDRGVVTVGILAGYGHSRGQSTSQITGYRATQSLKGYSGGLSMTWYEDAQQRLGFYSDNWVLYSAFRNSVKGDELAGEAYRSQGITASTELGYTIKFALENDNAITLQPQIQMVWMDVKANNHREENGSLVKSTGDGNVATRAGVRGQIDTRAGSVGLHPFIEANWLHNSKRFGVSMDDATTNIEGAKDVVEFKPGIGANLTDSLEVIAQASVQKGHDRYSNTGGMLSVRYAF